MLLFAVVLAKVQKLKHVRMPRLQVHSEGPLSLATPLINVAGGFIEDTEHGNNAIGSTIGAADVAASRAYVVDRHPDAT